LKATNTWHVAAGASVVPQVVSSTKSVGLVPARVIEARLIVAVPLLVRVTVCAAEVVPWVVVGKVRLAALSVSVDAAVPVPVNVTVCGEPAALSVTLNVPESAAAEAGLNAT
jgi:hypothetical protein